MNNILIYLAVEDNLSEVVLRKIIQESGRPYNIKNCFVGQGFGRLKKNIESYNKAARNGVPILVLTDLDNINLCPPEKINSWIRENIHPNLLFRIAVVEVESWVMAHREAFAEFTGIDISIVPTNPDQIPDPKQKLINLTKKSRSKQLKEDITPRRGSTSTQGPNYNGRLQNFIEQYWDVESACANSESLMRTARRIREFQPE